MLHPATIRAFHDELAKIAAATTFVDAKILQVQPFDKDFDHIIAASENKDGPHISHLFADRHFEAKGPAVTVDLLQGPDGKRWAVNMMHVRPDLRGQGLGKKIWNVIRKTHPNSQFGVTPDPVKDKAVSKADLFKVYKSYGFTPHPKMKNWMETFGTAHPSFKEKTAALSAAQKVEQHHLDPDWKSFEKNLKGAKFRQAASSHPKSDSKLQAYIKSFGGYLSSKKIVGQVPSRTSAKKHKIKKLEGGRLGCSCKDWQYKHSHQGTDCDHIESFRRGKTKMSSVTLHAFRDELEKIAARRGLKEIRNLVASGKGREAASLAQKAGVLKPTALGHQVKDIGRGSEGLATMVAGPEHGLAVRKTYDPRGLSTPEMIARKEQVGRATNSPHVAQFYGSQQTPGGLTSHMMEYVPGSTPIPSKQNKPAIRQAKQELMKGSRRAGFVGAVDVRPGNMVQTPEGTVKAIDYLPMNRGEVASGNLKRQNNVSRVAKGKPALGNADLLPTSRSFPINPFPDSTPVHELKAQMFRGGIHSSPGHGIAARPPAAQSPTPGGALGPTRNMRAPPLAAGAPTRVVPPPVGM